MADRRRISLAGTWGFVPDQFNTGLKSWFKEPDPNALEHDPRNHDADGVGTIPVPACWNMARRELFYFEQRLWYYRRFPTPRLKHGERAFLCFEGSYYHTKVWLNEIELGEHRGGYGSFEFEITDSLRRRRPNFLAVAVDAARLGDRAPETNKDWANHGGLHRDVFIEVRPARFITNWWIGLDKAGRRIVGRVLATHAGQAEVRVPALGLAVPVTLTGKDAPAGSFSVPVPPGLKRWSPESPTLYRAEATFGDDVRAERVGFRTVGVRKGRILLNGQPIFLKGVCVHEDHPTRGHSLTDADRRTTFRQAKALGCNFLRLAHYPHSRRMAELADREGILLWEEIPLYWEIAWKNPATQVDATNQLDELIARDRNRPSVILWAIANETSESAPGRTEFLTRLARRCRRTDPTRLVTAALIPRLSPTGRLWCVDPLAAELDVIGLNQYGGWYGGGLDKADRMANYDASHYPDTPLIASEFGADALAGFRGRIKFTEDWQAAVYRRQLRALSRCPNMAGVAPWLLFDFRSPRRQNRHQAGFNRKGLLADDWRTRKMAFSIFRDFAMRAR